MAPFVVVTTAVRLGKRAVQSPSGWVLLLLLVYYMRAVTTATAVVYLGCFGDTALGQAHSFNQRFVSRNGLALVMFHHALVCYGIAKAIRYALLE